MQPTQKIRAADLQRYRYLQLTCKSPKSVVTAMAFDLSSGGFPESNHTLS
jgi:hypothetical protein